jgi:hypothetical protein
VDGCVGLTVEVLAGVEGKRLALDWRSWLDLTEGGRL